MTDRVRLASFGSLIIDDIIYTTNGSITKEYNNILGGGGVHAIYGMRIWFPSTTSLSKQIGYASIYGTSCPESIRDQLNSLQISLHPIIRPNEPQPKAWNKFIVTALNNETRDFGFYTPFESYSKFFRIKPEELPLSWCSDLECIHLLCSTKRFKSILEGLRQRRDPLRPRCKIVFEPSPDSCQPKYWKDFVEMCSEMDVISPNHEEALCLLSAQIPELKKMASLDEQMRRASLEFLKHGVKVVIIRAGEKGCYASFKDSESNEFVFKRFPAYWSAEVVGEDAGMKEEHIVDVTGAGNSFCGGVCAALVKCSSDIDIDIDAEVVRDLCAHGTVSASFTVERLGVPVVKSNGKEELWNNGCNPDERLAFYKSRTVDTTFILCSPDNL